MSRDHRGAILVALALLASGEAPAQGEKLWSERFPEVAKLVRHVDRRMGADEGMRKRVITELTFGRPRDSKVYPPFLRALLDDPSAEIRGLAVDRLAEHQVDLN